MRNNGQIELWTECRSLLVGIETEMIERAKANKLLDRENYDKRVDN